MFKKLSDHSRIKHQKIPYTQVSNTVINHIKNGDAFLVWCYLLSKSLTWKVIKEHIKNKFGFGDTKIKHIFAYLKRANLISYAQITCAKGQFAHCDIMVLSGADFDINQPFRVCASVGSENRPAVDRTSGFGALRNKEDTKQRKELNKEKNICASSDARERSFLQFWKEYPKKRDKKRARDQWYKINPEIYPLIMADIEKRKMHDAYWQTKQFIPDPRTYLHNSRWDDEIISYSSTKPETNRKQETCYADVSTQTTSMVSAQESSIRDRIEHERLRKLTQGYNHATQGREASYERSNTKPSELVRTHMRQIKDILLPR